VALEIGRQDPSEIHLRRAVGRAIVVGQVEVGDPEVKSPTQNGAASLEHIGAAEILPQAQGDGRQVKPAAPAAAIGHGVVAGGVGDVGRFKGHGAYL
jgi:hypothetical protein